MDRNEAIKIVKSHYPANKQMLNEALEFLIPELKESEDERIRNFISNELACLRATDEKGSDRYEELTNAIAWLENQSFEPNWCHHKVDLSDCSEEYCKAYYDGWNNCNMQHSQCKSESNDVIKCLINGMKFYYDDNEEATWGTDKFSMKVKDIIAWLEKQGEQKPKGNSALEAIKEEKIDNANKVESKFKVGDWVVSNNKKDIFLIKSFNNGYCTLEDTKGRIYSPCLPPIEDNNHLWTIQDAKDGDVVVDKSDGAIGIFQSIGHHPDGGTYNDPSYCFLYCRYDDGFFYADFENGNTMNSDDAIPATKEQRDTLIKAIADAGYTFDFEKKELKKIEQKLAWSEDDERVIDDAVYYLEHYNSSKTGFEKQYVSVVIDKLKSLKPKKQ